MKSHLLLILGAIIAAPFTHAVVLDIDGGDPTDGILGEFPNYLLSDNTKDILPDAVQTDGTVTLTLADESICQWNNAGYAFNEGYEIDWHCGGPDLVAILGAGSANLADSLTAGLYYTIKVDSTTPININNLDIKFYRNDETGPPRRYYILFDEDGDGYDLGDVIADTADLPDAEAGTGLIPWTHFGSAFTKVLNPNTGTSGITSTEYRFYASNTPNPAGNTHWFYASVDYTPTNTSASPIVYEGFEGYTPDAPIELEPTPHGGTGWAGDWFAANSGVTDDDYWYGKENSLTNGAYAGTGMPYAPGHAYYSVGAEVQNAHNVIRRTMSTSFNGNTGGTFYFSFLVDGTSFDNGNIFRYSIEMDSATGRRIYLESLADGNLQYRIAGSPGGGSGNPQITGTTTTSPFSGPGTYFIVGKVELTSGAGNDGPNTVGGDGLDNFYAQVYGTSDTVGLEPGSWTLQALGSSLDDVNEFNQISLISSNVDQYAFDEVRVGLTWQDVTGIAPSAPVIVPVGVDIAIAGPDVQISFESLSSQSYTLEYSTDEMATWDPVPDQSPVAPVTGNDGALTITDPGGTPATGGKIFYRVSTTAP